jgi:hypothetical protein
MKKTTKRQVLKNLKRLNDFENFYLNRFYTISFNQGKIYLIKDNFEKRHFQNLKELNSYLLNLI